MKYYTNVKHYRTASKINPYCEMNVNEIGFICGLIRDNKPRKIVEVGIASGGTSVEILKCINNLGLECRMYSIDLSLTMYKDKNKECGYLIKQYKNEFPCPYHKLLTGDILPARLEEIGDNIDFLILDTTHTLPGEILDFLAAFHHLSSNAIVVLHDTILHYTQSENFDDLISGNNINGINAIATCTLFSCVTADKYINLGYECDYPNIAAFRLNEDTEKYLLDVFNALMLPWAYLPEKRHLDIYSEIFQNKYPVEAFEMWKQAILRAKEFFYENDKVNIQSEYLRSLINGNRILLYGAGTWGKLFYDMLTANSCDVAGFIVSDNQSNWDTYCGKPVFYYSSIPPEYDDCLIINAIDNVKMNDILFEQSKYRYICIPLRMWELSFNYSEVLPKGTRL